MALDWYNLLCGEIQHKGKVVSVCAMETLVLYGGKWSTSHLLVLPLAPIVLEAGSVQRCRVEASGQFHACYFTSGEELWYQLNWRLGQFGGAVCRRMVSITPAYCTTGKDCSYQLNWGLCQLRGAVRRQMVTFTPADFTSGKDFWYKLNWGLGQSQRWSGCFGRKTVASARNQNP